MKRSKIDRSYQGISMEYWSELLLVSICFEQKNLSTQTDNHIFIGEAERGSKREGAVRALDPEAGHLIVSAVLTYPSHSSLIIQVAIHLKSIQDFGKKSLNENQRTSRVRKLR